MNIDFQADGLEGLMSAMERAGDIPEDMQKEMVDQKAKVTEESIRFFAAKMLVGPYNEYAVAASAKRKKPRTNKSGASAVIKFEGTQHGNRLGEIAFINNYGKKKQPARPFISEAIKDARDPGSNAAMKVLDEFLKKEGL